MYNVVVDSEETGKQLLQNGALRRRVTIIPLNKIQSYVVQPRVQQATARLVCGFFFGVSIFSILFFLFFPNFLFIFRLGRIMQNWHFL